jgi:nucleosome binding factor SPN SPT16 subunit
MILLSFYSIWLLGYEFSDTIVLLTREKVIFAVSSKKSKYDARVCI